jgi:endonuclease III
MPLPSNLSKILKILDKLYPKARSALHYSNPLEMLVAAILAAQCTDERVNKVSPILFKKFRKAQDYAQADPKKLEQEIRSINFYRNKARSIQNCCAMLVRDFGAKVPKDLKSMVQLPGVGRKTANMVLGNCYGVPGIIVDTHVKRVAYRLGLTKNQDPEKIETDLGKIVPKGKWVLFSHQLTEHGRAVCKAPRPLCSQCDLESLCPKAGVNIFK